MNIKKADKGNTTFVRDNSEKNHRGKWSSLWHKFLHLLQEPIVASTANKVKLLFNKLHVNKRIDAMTFEWLNKNQNLPRVPEFYTLTKTHKPNLAGRPMVSGNDGLTESISRLIDSLLQPTAKKQESYIKDTCQLTLFVSLKKKNITSRLNYTNNISPNYLLRGKRYIKVEK